MPIPRFEDTIPVSSSVPAFEDTIPTEGVDTTETMFVQSPSTDQLDKPDRVSLGSIMVRAPKGAFENMTRITSGAYDRGNAGLELNNLYMRQLFGEKLSDDATNRMAQLRTELGEEVKTEGFHQEVLRAASEQTPQLLSLADRMAKRALQGGEVGAAGAILMGQLGPQAATPEELVTVPVATLVGMKIGAHVGFVEHSFLQNSAEAYGEFSQIRDKFGVPIDEDLARFGSYLVGAANAGLDFVSLKSFEKLFTGGRKVINLLKPHGSVMKVPKEKSKVRQLIQDAATAVGVEAVTEGAQEGVKEGMGELLKWVSDQDFEPKTADEVINNVGAAMDEAFKASIAFVGVGMVARGGLAVAEAKTRNGQKTDPKTMIKALESHLNKVAKEGTDGVSPSQATVIAEKMKNDDRISAAEQPIADEMLAQAQANLALEQGVPQSALREIQMEQAQAKSVAAQRDVDTVRQDTLREIQALRSDQNITSERLNELLTDFETLLSEQKKVGKPQTLIEFLEEQGGLQDDGTLNDLGIDRRRRLRNDTGGLTVDQAITQATEAGFFDGKPSRARFAGALKRDFKGTDVVVRGADRQAQADLDTIGDTLVELNKELDAAGITGTRRERLEKLRERIQKGETPSEVVDPTTDEKDILPPPERASADYEQIAAGRRDRLKTATDKGGTLFSDVMGIGSDVFTPVSTRLGKINPKLKVAVRKYVFNTGMRATADKQAIKPFMDALPQMGEADYRMLDFALKNRDLAMIDKLVAKYDMTDAFANVRKTLDAVFAEAKEVGLDMNYIENYFPRAVKKDKVNDFLTAIRGREGWSEIEGALIEADPNSTFTDQEKVAFINSYLRGFTSRRIMLARKGFTKERTVGYIDPELNEFYEPSSHALVNYLNAVRHDIEARRLFGRGDAKSEESIGAYVKSLVDQGLIDAKNEQDVKKILKALVEPQGTRGVVTGAKNLSYIYVMGNPISAITQIGDLAFSMVENGYYRSAKALGKASARKSQFTKEDLGIENIIQEFDGESTSSRAVRKVFRAVGLEYVDNIGKEVNVNAAYERLQAAAKANSPEFQEQMRVTFGDQATTVRQELIDGVASENVKFLLFSELSDVQPISLAEMPVGYLNSGNGRVLYMLKTYTLKLIDIHRRKWIDEIASGERARVAKGTRNLVRLGAALMLMGATSDVLKDLILGREIEMDDLVIDNILKTFGVSKYQIYKTRQEGLANAFWQWLLVPPIGAPVNDLSKDVKKIGFGDGKLKDAEVLQRVPVGGKLYFWWFGGGAEKKKKDKTPRKRRRRTRNTRRKQRQR